MYLWWVFAIRRHQTRRRERGYYLMLASNKSISRQRERERERENLCFDSFIHSFQLIEATNAMHIVSLSRLLITSFSSSSSSANSRQLRLDWGRTLFSAAAAATVAPSRRTDECYLPSPYRISIRIATHRTASFLLLLLLLFLFLPFFFFLLRVDLLVVVVVVVVVKRVAHHLARTATTTAARHNSFATKF